MNEINFNCYSSEDMWTPSDVLRKPKVEFYTLGHFSTPQSRKNTVNFRARTRRRPVANFSKNISVRDQIIEEPWLLHSSLTSRHVTDIETSSNFDIPIPKFVNRSDFDVNEKKNCFELNNSLSSYYPVEEPWIFEPSKKQSDNILAPTEEQHHLVPETLLIEEENKVVRVEDSILTVILINSSICTMQRIAILENDKLVELLLEPVKNNVQCGSVYLGVVSKLVPHMGGAFVSIGSTRAAFMDIKPNREPFILHPFHSDLKEKTLTGSLFDVGLVENRTSSHEEPEEVEDEQNEDEDDEFIGDENPLHFDVLEVIKENINGSAIGNESVHQDISIKGKGREESKWAHVQRGSKIIVQVVKEGLGTKGPTLTPYPILRSRFWILIPRCNTIGISKKISGGERTRLRVIAKTLQPPGFGVTVRTVASGHSLDELQKDLEGLLLTWKSIEEHAKSAALAADEGVEGAVPTMLHKAMGQTLAIVQDYFNEKVKSMVVDSPRTYHEVTNYLQKIAPDLCDRVEFYSKRTPLFDEYNIEGEINSMLSKRVPLANGGYLVIEQTEALVSIDVNGGHCMLGQGTSQEKAILGVNLAAAKQIARELRLRDVGGIIVVDFIDMMDDSNKRLVYEEVKMAVERDRSTVKVSELSRHGLMEITRKRVRPSVTFMISEPCACCHATGRVEALDTTFSKIEHEICRLLSMIDQKSDPENAKSWPRFILRVDRQMCNYLTSGKRTRLAVLSSSLRVWILLKVARGLTRGTFDLKPLTDDIIINHQNQVAPVSLLRPTEAVTYARNRKVMLLPLKKRDIGGK